MQGCAIDLESFVFADRQAYRALLPQYGGVWPVFWALYHGERQLGQTVHIMTSAIDRGDILAQEAYPVTSEMSLYGIYAQVFLHAAPLVSLAITNLLAGRRQAMSGPASFFRQPTFAQGREFRRSRRLLTWGELLARVPGARTWE